MPHEEGHGPWGVGDNTGTTSGNTTPGGREAFPGTETGTTNIPPSATGDNEFEYVIDQILTGIVGSPNTPLGNGFLDEYEIDTGRTGRAGESVMSVVNAEEFLTSDEYQQYRRDMLGVSAAYKYVYFKRNVGEQARAMTPAMRIQIKNLLANAGLIDLSKTIGSGIDEELLKGIKLAMEFSMNNGGQMSWVNAVKVLEANAFSINAFTQSADYTLSEEAISELGDELLKTAEIRKGSPLSDYEKSFIRNKFTEGPIVEYQDYLEGLDPGSKEQLVSIQGTGAGQYIPGTPAEEPDVELLQQGSDDLLDEVFKPREELERQADLEDDTFSRMSANLRGLNAAESTPVKRI